MGDARRGCSTRMSVLKGENVEKTNLIGQRFGKLVVIGKAPNKEYANGKKKSVWICQCDCGEVVVRENSYLKNRSRSCGCDSLHGKYKNIMDKRLYVRWQSMRRRCNKPQNIKYRHYGARGIRVCKEWDNLVDGYANFYYWSMNNGYKPDSKYGDCTLDRINVNGDYEPSNCRWISNAEQQLNKTNLVMLSYKGETHCMAEWGRILGLNPTLIRRRKLKGWSDEKILTTPPNSTRTKKGKAEKN